MVSLAARVSNAPWSVEVGTPGRIRHFSQTALEPPPLTNCRLWSLSTLLVFGGLRIPNDWAEVLRKATGKPERDSKGNAQGTTTEDALRALSLTTPWVHFPVGPVPDDELLALLESGRAIASVSTTYGLLPKKQRRHSPRFTGGHQVTLTGARIKNGLWQVLFDDPLGPPDYTGDWVNWRDVKPAIWTSGGKAIAMIAHKGAALGSLLAPVRAFSPPATVTAARGTAVFTVNTNTAQFERDGSASSAINGPADYIVRSTQWPQRPPQGEFVHLIDGRYIRVPDATITEATPPEPVDTTQYEAIIRDLESQLMLQAARASYGSAVLNIPRPMEVNANA